MRKYAHYDDSNDDSINEQGSESTGADDYYDNDGYDDGDGYDDENEGNDSSEEDEDEESANGFEIDWDSIVEVIRRKVIEVVADIVGDKKQAENYVNAVFSIPQSMEKAIEEVKRQGNQLLDTAGRIVAEAYIRIMIFLIHKHRDHLWGEWGSNDGDDDYDDSDNGDYGDGDDGFDDDSSGDSGAAQDDYGGNSEFEDHYYSSCIDDSDYYQTDYDDEEEVDW